MPIDIWTQAAIDRLGPLLAAEAARGNVGRLLAGDAHETRAGWAMRHPLDLDALRVQFRFGPGIALLQYDERGAIEFSGVSSPSAAFAIRGGPSTSWLWRRRREAWWRAWRSAPRPPVDFENPFPEEGV